MKKNPKKKKIEYNKKLLIFLIIVIIIYGFLKAVENNNKLRNNAYKMSSSKEYVYTVHSSDTNKAKVPYINLLSIDANKVNNEITNITKEYLESKNPNKTVTYRYNHNKNILSIVLMFRDIDQYNHLTYNYKTYVFDLNKGAKLLTNDEIIGKFNITYAQVNEVMAKSMQQKYVDEVKKGFIDRNECNYACYLQHRDISRYIDKANYYIENSHLIVYRAFEVFSIFGEEDYFTRNDFKFLIK